VVVGDFNTSLSLIKRSSKQKVNKEILELNDNINQMDLTDVYRIFHPTTAQYTFSAAHGTFFKIDHILGHKASLSKYKKISSWRKEVLYEKEYFALAKTYIFWSLGKESVPRHKFMFSNHEITASILLMKWSCQG
jgi:hypothetical protein